MYLDPLSQSVGAMVQAAAHHHGAVGPVPFEILKEKTQPMKEEQKLTADQERFVDELVAAYGIDRSDVTFFPNVPQPFLGYEAQTALANQLADIRDIDSSVEPATRADAVTIKCRLELANGCTRSGIGVANTGELGADGKPMTHQQQLYTATSRALRNALRAAGYDLIKMHHAAASGEEYEWCGVSKVESPRTILLRQVHVLGEEAGLIRGQDKTLWHSYLVNRYQRKHSGDLDLVQLADLAAVLRAMTTPVRIAA